MSVLFLEARRRRRKRAGRGSSSYRIRGGRPSDAARLLSLIDASRESGHLLPRNLDELTRHASRFIVATFGDEVVGCVELAPIGSQVAEVRSLVVHARHRGRGIASRLMRRIELRATREEFATLCAFTHDAACFLHWGFTIVPHAAVPEKMAVDCCGCSLLGRCGQVAVTLALTPVPARVAPLSARSAFVPVPTLAVGA
jgi:N-acetylglutamate synthase-like GNAT family acetyltransferase